MQKAMLWHTERNGVRCDLCARRCFISKGQRGFCQVRLNKDNELFSLNYGKLIAVNVDPIEKKPLFHFYPGSNTMSIASAGCNFACAFCFDPQTRVLTDKGAITLENLFKEGRVSRLKDGFVSLQNSYTTITHTGKCSKISKVYKHFYNGKLILIKPYHLPKIKATPNHTFFVFDKSDKKIKKIMAEDINKNHFLLIPKLKLNGSTKTLDLKKILSEYESTYRKGTKINRKKAEEILRLHRSGKTSRKIGEIVGFHPVHVRRLIGRLEKEGFSEEFLREENKIIGNESIKFKTEKSSIPRYIPLDEDFATLLGYYCAEGWVTKCPKRVASHNLVFSFGKHEMKKIKMTKRLLEKVFGVKPRVIERRATVTVEVGKASVAILFKILVGNGNRSKNVPGVIIRDGNEKTIHSFLKAYFEGDGYKGRGVLEYVTCSEDLAYNIFSLLLKFGLIPSFFEFVPNPKGSIEGRTVNQSPFFRVKIYGEKIIDMFLNGLVIKKLPRCAGSRFFENEDYHLIPIRKISEENYSGFVYNLEVENKDHSYLSNFVSVGNCCNFTMSQGIKDKGLDKVPGEKYDPEDIVELVKKNGCKSISYTYTEPTVFFEFAYKTAKLAHRSNIKNTFVTNGYMTDDAVKKIAKFLDAATIDIKASADQEFYKKFMSVPKVAPIFACLKRMKKQKIFTEITNLIVPQVGDDIEKCEKLAQWITSELGSDVPFHIIQFFPSYKLMELPPTPEETLEKCADVARRAGLRYVYVGNVPGHPDENTYCHNCRELLIERVGFSVKRLNLINDRCPNCGFKMSGVI